MYFEFQPDFFPVISEKDTGKNTTCYERMFTLYYKIYLTNFMLELYEIVLI